MSARTEKATRALEDAAALYDSCDYEAEHPDAAEKAARKRLVFLLDIATIQANIAQAEALELLAKVARR